MKVELSDELVMMIAEYDMEVSKPVIDNIERITELQMLIAIKASTAVQSEKLFNRATA